MSKVKMPTDLVSDSKMVPAYCGLHRRDTLSLHGRRQKGRKGGTSCVLL